MRPHSSCPLQMQGHFLGVFLGPSVQMFSESWELTSSPHLMSLGEELGDRLFKTVEPGTYWKVQPSTSGSFSCHL